MRIRRLTVKNFGKFENYAVDFNGNLAVIAGQNEAGKSTIFDMIKVLLFGLPESVTAQERKGYVRYGAGEAHISGEFERADGSPLTLSRTISEHSCDLNVNENFDFKNLGSAKAPIVSSLTKEVYENIYALDFHTMSAIKDDIWQGIREEFMGADMAKELVSASDAIQLAKNRADELYRRGSAPSVINGLMKERDALKEKLDEVTMNQKAAAADYLSLEKTKREINDMQNRIEFENAFIAEAEKMNGLKRDVERIKTLAGEAGDLSPYKMWLPNIREEYLALKQEEADAALALEQAKNFEPEDAPAEETELPEKYAKALEHEGEIRSFISCWEPQSAMHEDDAAGQPDETDANEKEAAMPKAPSEEGYIDERRDWEELKGEVLSGDIEDGEINNALDQINSMSLAEKLALYKESKDNLDEIIGESSQPQKSGARTFFFVLSLVISIAFILSGVSLFFTDYIADLLEKITPADQWFAAFVGFFDIVPLSTMITADIFSGAGLILLIVALAFIKGRSVKTQLKNREEIVGKAREESEYNRVEFEKELFGLPVSKIKIKRADPSITDDVIKLKEARQKLFGAERAFGKAVREEGEEEKDTESAANKEGFEEEVERLALELLDFPCESAADNLTALGALLDEAIKAEAEAGGTAAEDKNIPPSEKEIAALEEKYEKAKEKLGELESLLGGDPESEVERIGERYAKLNRAVVLRDEILEKYPNFKEVSERLNQLIKSGWPYEEEAVSGAQGRIEDMREAIGAAQSNLGLMENSVKKALLGHDPAELASELLKLEEKITESKLEYDKMRLSEVIIKQGHDTFSKMHQPEVLQRASYYLSILTDGKYSELDLDQETSEITVLTQDGKYRTPRAARLSQATREQIYLSIRLSVIESFDEEREAMPITLDEALITWDKNRLTAGLDLLAQIARKRQILIFTCHDFIVDTMRENQPTAQIIELK